MVAGPVHVSVGTAKMVTIICLCSECSGKMVEGCKTHPPTCSLSSFERMMMAVKVDGPAGRPDLVRESTPITGVNPPGQAHRPQKKEPSWFNFISHMEEQSVPSSREEGQQGQPKQVPLDSAHYPNLMAGSSGGGENEADANVCSNLRQYTVYRGTCMHNHAVVTVNN